MDILDRVLTCEKSTLLGLVNALINSATVLNLINSKIERYASVKRIEKGDSGYLVCFMLAGDGSEITVRLGEIRLNEQKNAVLLHGLSSTMPWLQHVFEDFVEGKSFELPENELLGLALKVL